MKKLFTFLAALSITACGWQLRGFDHNQAAQGPLPTQLNLQMHQRNSKMGNALQKLLKQKNISVSSEAPLTLVIESEDMDKRPLSVTDTGVTAQYQLTLNVRYHYQNNNSEQTGDEQLPAKNIISRRNYDFDAKLIVAKTQEEKALLDEMRTELSQRILDHLPR